MGVIHGKFPIKVRFRGWWWSTGSVKKTPKTYGKLKKKEISLKPIQTMKWQNLLDLLYLNSRRILLWQDYHLSWLKECSRAVRNCKGRKKLKAAICFFKKIKSRQELNQNKNFPQFEMQDISTWKTEHRRKSYTKQGVILSYTRGNGNKVTETTWMKILSTKPMLKVTRRPSHILSSCDIYVGFLKVRKLWSVLGMTLNNLMMRSQ